MRVSRRSTGPITLISSKNNEYVNKNDPVVLIANAKNNINTNVAPISNSNSDSNPNPNPNPNLNPNPNPNLNSNSDIKSTK